MKRTMLILMTLAPFSLAAQVRNATNTVNQNAAGTVLSAEAAPLNDSVSSVPPDPAADTESALESDPQGKPSAQPGHPVQETSEPQPMVPLSMVGYVDDAIVGSQVRIRADAGFHDTVPDSAEFFYGQCICTNVQGAPGHNFYGASDNINFQEIYVDAEYAPIKRLSVFVEIPFRSIEPQANGFVAGSFDPSQSENPSLSALSGLSDIRAGFKVSLASSFNHAVTFQARAYFPSGSAADDLGTGHYSFEPSLLYYQRLANRWALESQIGDWHPIGGSTGYSENSTTPSNFAGDVLLYGTGLSYQLINDEHFRLTPVLEMFGWHVFGGLETLASSFTGNTICTSQSANPTISPSSPGCSYSAAGINIVNIKPGMRFGFGSRNSVYLGFGQQVTHEGWYKNIVRLEYRYAF